LFVGDSWARQLFLNVIEALQVIPPPRTCSGV
jgi:hypothetical protein